MKRGRKYIGGPKASRERRKEKLHEYGKRRYQKNREEQLRKGKEYREAHKEYFYNYSKKYNGEYYLKNREKILKKAKERYQRKKQQGL